MFFAGPFLVELRMPLKHPLRISTQRCSSMPCGIEVVLEARRSEIHSAPELRVVLWQEHLFHAELCTKSPVQGRHDVSLVTFCLRQCPCDVPAAAVDMILGLQRRRHTLIPELSRSSPLSRSNLHSPFSARVRFGDPVKVDGGRITPSSVLAVRAAWVARDTQEGTRGVV